MNINGYTKMIGAVSLSLLLISCVSDPRKGGIFWSEAGAQKRLVSMQNELAEKEALLASYKSEVNQLQLDQSRRKSQIAKLSSQIPAPVLASLANDMSSRSKRTLNSIAPLHNSQSTRIQPSPQQQATFDKLIKELDTFESGQEKLTNKEQDLDKLLADFNKQEQNYNALLN